jgi:hypothetical protein
MFKRTRYENSSLSKRVRDSGLTTLTAVSQEFRVPFEVFKQQLFLPEGFGVGKMDELSFHAAKEQGFEVTQVYCQ